MIYVVVVVVVVVADLSLMIETFGARSGFMIHRRETHPLKTKEDNIVQMIKGDIKQHTIRAATDVTRTRFALADATGDWSFAAIGRTVSMAKGLFIVTCASRQWPDSFAVIGPSAPWMTQMPMQPYKSSSRRLQTVLCSCFV